MNYDQLFALTLAHNDKRVEHLLRNQIKDPQNPEYGGIWEPFSGWAAQKSAMNAIEPFVLAYCTGESRFYRAPEVKKAIEAAFDFCKYIQRPDGTFDLFDCNFYSAPDTAFGIQSLWRAYQILEKDGSEPEILEKLERLISSSAEGVAAGGFHTPNHRWVISSALLAAWKITGRSEFLNRAQEYLAEGIDCSEDGEFTERSAAIYNIVNDYALVLISGILQDKSLLTFVEKNLNMMMTFYEADGSVFTMNSTRQDNSQKMFPAQYYYLYRDLSEKTGNLRYASFAEWILENLVSHHEDCAQLFAFVLLHPEWKLRPEIQAEGVEDFSRLYSHSGIARIRKGKFSASLMKENPTPFAVQLGEISIYLRIGISFFSVRNLLAQTLEKTESGYRLTFSSDGTYKQPFGKNTGTSDWGEMDHTARQTLVATRLKVELDLKEQDNGVDLTISTSGCDRVPFKFEFGIPAGVQVINDSFECLSQPGVQLIAKQGDIRVDNGKDCLTFGPAFADNAFIRSRAGIVPPSDKNLNLYFTGMTNFSRTISFRF